MGLGTIRRTASIPFTTCQTVLDPPNKEGVTLTHVTDEQIEAHRGMAASSYTAGEWQCASVTQLQKYTDKQWNKSEKSCLGLCRKRI